MPNQFRTTGQQPSAAVKDKLRTLQASLPKGVEIVPVYDRSEPSLS